MDTSSQRNARYVCRYGRQRTGNVRDGAVPCQYREHLGLLVSLSGYPLAYCIHEGNKYEGHTMMPVIEEVVRKYELDDFVVVADSGLMNEQNIAELEQNGYKYINILMICWKKIFPPKF